MKKYCLDTNIISILSAQLSPEDENFKKQEKIKKIFESKNLKNIYITEISVLELMYGMNKKINEFNNKYLNKDNTKKLFSNTYIKNYKKFNLEMNFEYNKLSNNEKTKIKQFGKQNNIIKFFQENKKIKKFCSSSFWEYKNIIFSGCIKSINFKNQDQSDILISAIAIRNNLILVTENEKDFKNIIGLKYENWCK